MHVLLLSPTSQLPTIVSMQSHYYPELMQQGYQHIQTGTKKQLEEIESEMMGDLYAELDISSEIN